MKYMMKLSLLFILLSMFTYAKDAEKLLTTVQEKYKSFEDVTVDFKQTLNGKTDLSGKLIYSKGNKIRLELKKSTVISDGSTIWNYNKEKNQVVVNNFEAKDPSYFTIDNFLFTYPSKCSVTYKEKDGSDMLIFVPIKNSGLDFKQASIILNKEFLVTNISVENLAGTMMNIQLSGYAVNKNVPENKFTFTPPEGTKVIDLRK